MHLFVFAGEASGDLHGAHLLAALRSLVPDLQAEGVGGPAMQEQPFRMLFPMEDFAVMGLTDVLLSFPKLWKRFRAILSHILNTQPDGVVLIDYPGFNLRLAKALRKKGYSGKIVQYVSPTVWAHGKHRIDHMAQTLDLLLTIYPFEAAHFLNPSFSVKYVGNPIKEYIDHHKYDPNWLNELGVLPDIPLIALFPGSRSKEIQRHLPYLLEAACRLKERQPELQFAMSYLSTLPNFVIPTSLRGSLHFVPKKYTYELMKHSRSAIAKSGTVTLELALHRCPTAVIYHVTPLNRLYGKYFLRLNLPHYCIVNILANMQTFPELIEEGISSASLAEIMHTLNIEGKLRQKCLLGCEKVAQLLTDGKASQTAAEAIAQLMRGNKC